MFAIVLLSTWLNNPVLTRSGPLSTLLTFFLCSPLDVNLHLSDSGKVEMISATFGGKSLRIDAVIIPSKLARETNGNNFDRSTFDEEDPVDFFLLVEPLFFFSVC